MALQEYEEALKLGKKEYRFSVSIGKSPYLPVLDEILSNEEIQTEQNMGLLNIPLDFVVGTATAGRTTAFAANFMPILDANSEFSFKWATLADAQKDEGIRDPIKVFEFMNRYYVVEGNKRVSVMKFYKAVSIPAYVTRKIPKLSDDEDIKLYYEFMDFNDKTGFNAVEFSVLGNAQRLIDLVGEETPWSQETKEAFNKVLFRFSKEFISHGGMRLNLKLGDAMVAFLNVYTFQKALDMQISDYKTNIQKIWNEIAIMSAKRVVDLVMDPAEVRDRKGFLGMFSTMKNCTVAFLYPKKPEESDWIYNHELGRNYLEETYPQYIKTIAVNDVTPDNILSVLEDVREQGATIIFEVGPQLMGESLEYAVEHPELTILNCSLNTPHKFIRTYYARMYEAKFLTGMIAGALADNNKIAYVADYPIYGMIANINAFALGAQAVNPRAEVYLAWSTKKDYDLSKFIWENGISIVSDQDMITPQNVSRMFGLYSYDKEGDRKNLVMPIWNWGIFYEKLIRSILAGVYDMEEWDERRPLNYWWGMSAGVIDIITSKHVPSGINRLVDHVRGDICGGYINVFAGEIKDQKGIVHNTGEDVLDPWTVMNMDWLVDNVVGSLPEMDELEDRAKPVVELKGVEV